MRHINNTLSAKIILSAELDNKTKPTNANRTRELVKLLNSKEIGYKPCIGCYHNSMERSFLIEASDFKKVKDFIFNAFAQESVLRIEKDKKTSLIFSNGRVEQLGTIKSTSINHAYRNCDNFTILQNRAFYTS